MNDQMTLGELIERKEKEEKPYRNAMGELLPWEEEEYEERNSRI